MEYRDKKKLVDYLRHLEHPDVPYPDGYITSKESRIEVIRWLIAYYNNKTASTPKEYLEALMNSRDSYDDYVKELKNYNIFPLGEVERLKSKIDKISFLYNWITYKKITGF